MIQRYRHPVDEMIRKQRGSKNFELRVSDPEGNRREIFGFSTERAAEDFLGRCKAIVAARKDGSELPGYLQDWIDNLEADRKQQLLDRNIITSRMINQEGEIWKHIDDWQEWLTNRRSEKHARESANIVRRIIKQILIVTGDVSGPLQDLDWMPEYYYKDLSAHLIENALSSIKVAANGQTPRTPSVDTIQHYRRAIKSFCKWMVEMERARKQPAGMAQIKVQTVSKRDRKNQGKRIPQEDVEKLLTCPDIDRRGIYIVALGAGLRQSEFEKIQIQDINLKKRQFWILKGKNKKDDPLPMSESVYQVFKRRLESGDEQIFKMPSNILNLMRKDTGNPTINFKDMRTTFCTMLAENGVHPKTAQILMRHSDINLTMNFYTDLGTENMVNALDLVDDTLKGT